jgi:hypothetical protein
MPNIQEIWLEIKGVGREAVAQWGLIAIVILLGISSFELGRLSALESATPVLSITSTHLAPHPRQLVQGGLYVASRSGSVYYYPWCTGATKILPANQVWFADESAAVRAGYRAAKNCKGME